MTVVEWHPDELLDKQKRGRLSDSERTKLDAHLARCGACRVEALAMEDFALELAEEDEDERASGSLARLVGAAVAERAPKRRKLVPAVAAAIVLLGAGSAAALYTGRRAPERAAPALDAVAEDLQRRADTWKEEPKTEPQKDDAPSEAAPATQEAPSASALFASANEARRAGRTREALRLYRELERRHPDSPEAKLSHAIVGRMLLDEDPRAALGEFDRYLGEGKGTLSEEALVGRALSLQKLGREAEERAAWEALLRTYPNSIHAARARARLAALGGG